MNKPTPTTITITECGAVADMTRESRFIIDPVCHEPAGHSGTHVCTTSYGRSGFHYTTARPLAVATDWDITTTHGIECQACNHAAGRAVDIAKVTGSSSATVDDGVHIAVVTRAVAS